MWRSRGEEEEEEGKEEKEQWKENEEEECKDFMRVIDPREEEGG